MRWRRQIRLDDVRRLGVGPGDRLLVTVPSSLNGEQIEQIQNAFNKNLPDIEVLVVTDLMGVRVVGQTKRRDPVGLRDRLRGG